MLPQEIIRRKREGRPLDPAEIGPKLGDLWTTLPESVRKALE